MRFVTLPSGRVVEAEDCGCASYWVSDGLCSQKRCQWHQHSRNVSDAFGAIAKALSLYELLLAHGWREPEVLL